MKRSLTGLGLAILLSGSLLSAGCHSPALSAMKSDRQKFAVGIVGSKELAGSKEILDYTSKAFSESAVVFDIRTAENRLQAQEALSFLASNKNIDLIVTDAAYLQYVTELAKSNPDKKFGIVGNAATADVPSVRLVNVNREHRSFVAGILLAGASPKVPLSVIVNSSSSTDSPDWKGLIEGIHYAGSSVAPTVLTFDEAMDANGLARIRSLPSRFIVLLDPVTAEQLAKLNESGKSIFSLHDLPKMYPGVVARPNPMFAAGVQEEIQALLNNSWQGKRTAEVSIESFFEILRPELFPTLAMSRQVETGLHNRTILPEDYLKPPVEGAQQKDNSESAKRE